MKSKYGMLLGGKPVPVAESMVTDEQRLAVQVTQELCRNADSHDVFLIGAVVAPSSPGSAVSPFWRNVDGGPCLIWAIEALASIIAAIGATGAPEDECRKTSMVVWRTIGQELAKRLSVTEAEVEEWFADA